MGHIRPIRPRSSLPGCPCSHRNDKTPGHATLGICLQSFQQNVSVLGNVRALVFARVDVDHAAQRGVGAPVWHAQDQRSHSTPVLTVSNNSAYTKTCCGAIQNQQSSHSYNVSLETIHQVHRISTSICCCAQNRQQCPCSRKMASNFRGQAPMLAHAGPPHHVIGCRFFSQGRRAHPVMKL